MVDIIIPAYNALNTINQTLASILYQNTKYEFKVTIVDDCSSQNYESLINFYNNFFAVNYLRLERNSGPGVARQFGLDNTNNPYIIFIDSDDVLANPDALEVMISNIISYDDDVLTTTFVEETGSGFLPKQNDMVWLHGKIYKREFLETNNIRFNGYRKNEDTGFNTLVFMYDLKYHYVDFKTYIWRNNQDSITRKNNYEFAFEGAEWFAKNMLWAIEVGLAKNLSKYKISYNSYVALCSTYFMYVAFYKTRDFSKMIPAVRKILNIYKQYPLDENEKMNIVEGYSKVSPFGDNFTNMFFSGVSFDDYINMIEGGYND